MLKLAPLFGHSAVLCRNKEIRIFGEAESGRSITVTLDSDTAVCTARDGRFLARLAPREAATGLTLTVTDGVETVVSTNIAIGEVYLAGGQSNMELELQNADEGPELIQSHNDAELRYFNVPKRSLWNEEAVQAEAASHWERIRPGMGRDMSAVAYFFAMKLRRTLNVPVGIIDCYWGGTSITCWMDENHLRQFAEGTRYLTDYAALVGDKTMAQWQAEEDKFQADMAAWNARMAEIRAANPGMDWGEINALCGPSPWNPPVGWGSPYRPGGLADTMLGRVAPASLTGMLFYQGEEDTWRTTQYALLLTAFIRYVRGIFRDDTLPFINTQLPMFINSTDSVYNHQWAELRQAQAQVAKQVAHTGLACLIDCGEIDNIHPTDKRTPGERLCDVALQVVYGMEAPKSPEATGKYTADSTLVVTLDAPVAFTRDGDACMEIAGEDGVWHPAAVAVEDARLLLTSPDVPHPVAARYAHANWARVRLFGQSGLPLAPFVLDH